MAAVTARVGGWWCIGFGRSVGACVEDRVKPPCFAEQPVSLSYRYLLVVLAVHLESSLRRPVSVVSQIRHRSSTYFSQVIGCTNVNEFTSMADVTFADDYGNHAALDVVPVNDCC